MYDHDDPNNSSHQPALDTPSSDRPPQFNWRNCGYDCGEGCEKASDDEGGGGVSDDETAVDAEEDQCSRNGSQDEGIRVYHDTDDATTESSGLDPTDYAMSDSLVVEPCGTADHSPLASAGGSARSRSPDPGVPYWVTNSIPVATPLPIEYFFLQTPLRLSPQYEHCRGDPASHLVVPDHSPLWRVLMDRSWNGYAPAYGYISPP